MYEKISPMGSLTQAAQERSAPVVTMQLDLLDEVIDGLDGRVDRLEMRLGSCLLHNAPATVDKAPRLPDSPVPCTGVPLGDKLAQIVARLRGINGILDALHGRIEL